MRLPFVCFFCLCVVVLVFLVDLFLFFGSLCPFLHDDDVSFAGYFLVRCLLSAFPALLRTIL